ncbi:LacI family DNA-binding transcriptional regulator [Bifidobacterium eulemuris]|uniref:LacI family DNA-binding transcriptional regulator n=1 Tax=Bifidobacterium eulemuris TaxID=1765219 RepID=A0A261GCT1_9BIFI|nr:LacI family DNA-binding transcriptional regulator [Bifidobacterium eulemuris]OZG69224.1 Periplasmic binding protein-like domain-containing protein [Bifidobacterium eulemuris]QOL31267.1 LacI family DNA-binding transcriptional regulator [Bifidobacterium eulemuris]
MSDHEQNADAAAGRAVTINDIAKAAGVSPATVSRSLSRPGRVNAETANRVRRIAQDLGYRATNSTLEHDQALRGAILAVAADLRYPIYAEFLYGMQGLCMAKNFCLTTAVSAYRTDTERGIIARFSPSVDGIVLIGTSLSDAAIRKAAQMRPLVAINRQVSGVQSVVCDDQHSLDEAVRTLKALGHTSIEYVAGPERSWQNGMRWLALLNACHREHIRLHQIPGPNRIFDSDDEVDEWFASLLDPSVTAVISYNDLSAEMILNMYRRHGMDVPGRVSVIGIDDIREGTLLTPALSSISVPRERMGELAATKLIERILRVSDGIAPVTVRSTFVRRDSIGPARAA